MDETRAVKFQSITYLAQEVENIGEGKTFIGCYLIIVQLKQSSKFQISGILHFIDFEVNKVLRLTNDDVRNGIVKLFFPLTLFGQHDSHDLANFQLSWSNSCDIFHISVSEEGIILMINRTGLKETVIFRNGQSQRFIRLIKFLHDFDSCFQLFVTKLTPIFENIFTIVDLIFKKMLIINPISPLEKTNFSLIKRSILDSEPTWFIGLYLIN